MTTTTEITGEIIDCASVWEAREIANRAGLHFRATPSAAPKGRALRCGERIHVSSVRAACGGKTVPVAEAITFRVPSTGTWDERVAKATRLLHFVRPVAGTEPREGIAPRSAICAALGHIDDVRP